jgi:hypothetical protein
MSTRCSIIYFRGVHLWWDCIEDKFYWDDPANGENDPIELTENSMRRMRDRFKSYVEGEYDPNIQEID